MFFIFNLILVAVAGLLVLVVAATASLPGRFAVELDSPEGDWVGRGRLPQSKSVKTRPPIATTRGAKLPVVKMQ